MSPSQLTASQPPLSVPRDFTKPSTSYRARAWLAMLGLLCFIVLYVGLASWFSYTAYRMIAGVFSGGSAAGFFAAIPAAFLAIFMWKALFFVRTGSDEPGVEIKADDQPQLFEFLYEIADTLNAPRPHRVFVSPYVNASVFYDLSILNFILPSKKNLVIGLGLVNTLNRSEAKAVLAHEFGHFAQRTMAVGRWVYIGEQIAGHIIAKRDVLDRMLDMISTIDLRVAWIGWIMRTVVWSIRSLMESVFRLVIMAQRALSREMEFQADKVAVSLAGSDAIVHSLYRLQPADEDWEDTIEFAGRQLAKGYRVTDMYALQSTVGEHKRRILNEPQRGLVPRLPASNPEQHRVFTAEIAQPPRMWFTHPPNTDREENAKETYIPAAINEDSAWTLFKNPEQLRKDVSAHIFADLALEKPLEELSIPASIEALNASYEIEVYDRKYCGAYLDRELTRNVENSDALYETLQNGQDVGHTLQQLYPSVLHDSLTQWRNLNEEIGMLEAIESGAFGGSGRVIQHRGQTHRRSRLPQLIADIRIERDQLLTQIEVHDRLCRSTHDAAAMSIDLSLDQSRATEAEQAEAFTAHSSADGMSSEHYAGKAGWATYLRSLAALLHYAEHGHANIEDLYGHLAVTTSMATAGGRASSSSIKRVMSSAEQLHNELLRIEQQVDAVQLPIAITKSLELKNWREALQKYELPPMTNANIGDWLNVIDSWATPAKDALQALRKVVLEELISAEHQVAKMYRQQKPIESAPANGQTPKIYSTLIRGQERERQKKLDWWTRFTVADGFVPGVLRFVVAASIVGAVVAAGFFIGSADVVIYNGLATTVEVQIGETTTSLLPNQHRRVSLGSSRSGQIQASTSDGRLIESFDESFDKGFATYVYSVAGAVPLVEWTASYGNAADVPPRLLGCERWLTSGADCVFEEPPNQLKTKGAGGTRTVLSVENKLGPQALISIASESGEAHVEQLVKSQALWGSSDSLDIVSWLTVSAAYPWFDEVITHRLKHNPTEVVTLRAQQDAAAGDQRQQLRIHFARLAQQHPNEPNYQYLALRMMDDGREQNDLFLEAHAKWPEHYWLTYASAIVHSGRRETDKAIAGFDWVARRRGPVFDAAADQLLRLYRFTDTEHQQSMYHIRPSTLVKQSLQLESGEGLAGHPSYVYSLLQKAELTSASRLVNSDTNPHVQVLLGASTGAEPAWQERALALPIDEITTPTILCYLAALAARSQQPYEPYLRKMDEFERQANLEKVCRKLITSTRNFETLEQILESAEGLTLSELGIAYAAGVIVMDENAPNKWRESAKRILFAHERPWL